MAFFRRKRKSSEDEYIPELSKDNINYDQLFNLFVEHRIKLMQYREKLIQKEAELDEREAELNERLRSADSDIEMKQLAFEKKKQEYLKEILDLKRRVAALQTDYESELYEYDEKVSKMTRLNMNELSRIERKEIAFCEELLKQAQEDSAIIEKYKDLLPHNGHEFERAVADILRLNGYSDVKITKGSHDYGADVLATKDHVKWVFQCKWYSHTVGFGAVSQAYGSIRWYRADKAAVITNSTFTRQAKQYAEEMRVQLFDGAELEKLRKNAYGDTK